MSDPRRHAPASVADLPAPTTLAEAFGIAKANAMLSEKMLREVMSAVRLFEAVYAIPADRLPVTCPEWRTLFETYLHVRKRVKRKRWANARWALVALLRCFDLIEDTASRKLPDDPAWCSMLATVSNRQARGCLFGFARWCVCNGIKPGEVTTEALEGYVAHRENRTLRSDLPHLKATIRFHWNNIVAGESAGGPIEKLPVPPDPRRDAIPFEELAPSLQNELHDILQKRSDPDPFDAGHRP